MTKPSAIYSAHDVVIIPFPYTDNIGQSKRRPALVLSDAKNFNVPTGQLMCAMITSGKALKWPYDTEITNLQSAGLLKPCVIRMKLFTIDVRLVLHKAGTIGNRDRNAFLRSLKSVLLIS
jgi:mRNA interferase MazF